VTILFSMRHSGALRNFGSTIRALEDAGHRIHLVFMIPDKRGDGRLLRELTEDHPGVTFAWAADGKARGFWSGLQRAVRTGGDYIRYWTPDYAMATALRDRAASRVPPLLRAVLERLFLRTPAGLRLATRLFRLVERSIPADPRVVDLVAAAGPDLLLVTPLVDLGSDQVEYLKAARTLGIRSGLAVHSWDNLTNKGVLRIRPQRVFVWNEAQKREAVTMHGAAPEEVVVTGAPVYDQWFARRPSTTREEFCHKAGLRTDRPFLLYLCSSAFIAADEAAFVTKWIGAIRAAPDQRLREAGIMVRPHPDNPAPWQRFDAAQFGNVAVWPRNGSEPVDRASKNDYFDSIYHAAAAVGINTSAQIEAGIVGRPVFTIRVPEYTGTQEGTLHFQHLLNAGGGLLRVADTFQEHLRDLSDALATPGEGGRRVTSFIQGFVRPQGLDVPATPRLVAAIEELGNGPKPEPECSSAVLAAVRIVLYPVAAVMNSGRASRRRAAKQKRQLPPQPVTAPGQRVTSR
jgi:hypothetical protein